MTGPAKPLSDDQAAVYDRQLRVWGVEVQNRLSSSRVLIVGGNGLAAEVAKNIVLAGVGHVGIADSTPCSQAHFGNFLVPADAAPESTVAEACARTLQGMNPFVEVVPEDCCSSSSRDGGSVGVPDVPPEVLARYDTVLSTLHGIVSPEAEKLEAACCDSGKQLFLSQSLGLCTSVYINLGGKHTYAEKCQPPQTQQTGDAAAAPTPSPLKEMEYPCLHAALSKPVRECLGRRAAAVHPMYQVLRVLRVYQSSHDNQQQQQQQPQDVLASMEALAASMEDKEGAPRNSINRAYLQDCAEAVAAPDAGALDIMTRCMQGPTSAVVGGVVANAIVKAISKVGAPLRNFFFFSPADGQGVVEDISVHAAAGAK